MADISGADSPWLVIIDMQTIFSQYPKWWGCPKFNDIIQPILSLAESYGDRVLLTRFVDASNPQGSWVPYYQEFPFAAVPGSNPIYDLVPEIANLDRGDNVVTMTTFSKWGNEVHGLRARTGKDPHLVLAGVATDCCVLSTAMSAAEAGAFVTVALDACAGSSAENQLAAQRIMTGYAPLISISTTEELLAQTSALKAV
jgi:nicotinamidase-related amidase